MIYFQKEMNKYFVKTPVIKNWKTLLRKKLSKILNILIFKIIKKEKN